MASGQAMPVHFVGSIPLPSTTAVFTKIPSSLPPGSLRRMPDGETGSRYMFVAFQRTIFANHGLGHVVSNTRDKENGWRTFPASEIASTMESFPELETTYDQAAVESYRIFSDLKRNGSLPKELKFQVCLPTPANFIGINIQPDFQALIEPHYETALLRASERTQAAVPHTDLAVQIDIAMEFAYLTGQNYEYFHAPVRYLPLDDKPALFEKLVSAIVRLADSVAEDVELGFHFCYGDVGAKHFIEPEDVGLIVEVAAALRQRVVHRIDWMHMPVPQDRTDEAYLAPLANLLPLLDPETEVYLGLVHANDLEGTRARLASARKVLGDRRFGISTECGLGRRSEKDLEGVLEVLRAVSGV